MHKLIGLLGVILLLAGCAGKIDRGPSLAEVGSHFSEAMRWGDYIGAGGHLHQDIREQFVAKFQADEDLHVVESQIFRIDVAPTADAADVEYRMQYYRLPSMRVKKWQWIQQWRRHEKKALKSGVWLIMNSPPEVP